MKVIKSLKTGSSAPLVIDDNGQLLFVKLRSGMSGEHSLITEYLCTQIGIQLGLPLIHPTFIILDSKLDISKLDIEIRDLVKKSYGWNIAFDYKSDPLDLKVDDVNQMDQSILSKLFLLDVALLNIDRTPGNLNLFKSHNKVYSIDYESSLITHELTNSINLCQNERVLQQLRNSPLYHRIESIVLEEFINDLSNIKLEPLMKEIPIDIINQSKIDKMCLEFEKKKRLDWSLHHVLDSVNQLTPENEEELKQRSNKNQEKFRKNFGQRL